MPGIYTYRVAWQEKKSDGVATGKKLTGQVKINRQGKLTGRENYTGKKYGKYCDGNITGKGKYCDGNTTGKVTLRENCTGKKNGKYCDGNTTGKVRVIM